MSTTCGVCGRDFKNASGMTGHRRLAHGVPAGARGESVQGSTRKGELADRLAALEQELEDWRSGRIVLPFDPELHTRDEDSAAKLESYVQARIEDLTEVEVKRLARKYNLWPLPDPGRKLRSYVPTGGL